MKTTLIFAHPYHESFSKAILDRISKTLNESDKEFHIIDLYKDKFNPVLSEQELSNYSKGISTDPLVKKYQNMLLESNELIFIFPIWWYNVPAILKGFLDKVLLKNFSWDEGKFGIVGKLTHIKQAAIISTMDTPNWYYKLLLHSPLKHSFQKGTLKGIGIKKTKWFSHGMISSSSTKSRETFINKISNYFHLVN